MFNPERLSLIVQPVGDGGIRFFGYQTDDVEATVTGAGYATNAADYGIRTYDLIFVSPLSGAVDTYILAVDTIDADGHATLARTDLGLDWQVSTIAALKAVNTASVSRARLDTTYSGGIFHLMDYADVSTLVAADTNNILSARSTFDTTKAWVRDGFDGSVDTIKMINAEFARLDSEDEIGAAVNRVISLGLALGLVGNAATNPDVDTWPGLNIRLPRGSVLWRTTLVRLYSGCTLSGVKGATTVRLASDITVNSPVIRTLAVPGGVGTYQYESVYVEGIKWDARSVPYLQWLAKADGTPVTDPEADYVMGTGALASGISGVVLAPVIDGGTQRLTSVTVTNGGSGWNGHPTAPYVPTTVRIRFKHNSGSVPHRLPSAYGVISGGTITSIVVTDPGLLLPTGAGAITAETAGGYADPSILYDPAVDRRNINATDGNGNGGVLLSMTQISRGAVRDCEFVGTMRAVTVTGCEDFDIHDNKFTDCGDLNGIRWQTAVIDYFINPDRTVSRNCKVYNNLSRASADHPRQSLGIFCYLTATGGCEVTDNTVSRCALVQVGTGPTSGRHVIARNKVFDVRGNQVMEGNDAKNLQLEDNIIDGCDGQVWGTYSSKNVTIRRNVYRNIWRQTLRQAEFISAFERATEYTGEMPVCFTRNGFVYDFTNNIPANSATLIGALSSVGAENWVIDGDTIVDDRTSAARDIPAMIGFFRSGSGSENLATRIDVRNCGRRYSDGKFNGWIPMFCGDAADDVIDKAYRLRVVDNPNHASESVQKISTTYASGVTGSVLVAPGFPPKKVTVMARGATSTLSSSFIELLHEWDAASGISVAGNYEYQGSATVAGTVTNLAVEIRDSANAAVFRASFVRWNKSGFELNITVATEGATVMFICEP